MDDLKINSLFVNKYMSFSKYISKKIIWIVLVVILLIGTFVGGLYIGKKNN